VKTYRVAFGQGAYWVTTGEPDPADRIDVAGPFATTDQADLIRAAHAAIARLQAADESTWPGACENGANILADLIQRLTK
jgi:hypothetical protein